MSGHHDEQRSSPAEPQGLYGVRIRGIDGGAYLGEVPAAWPAWDVVVERSVAALDERPEAVEADHALLRFGDGATVELRRRPPGGSALIRLPGDVPDTELAHPYLSAVGMLSAYWGGRIAFHAGAVGVDGRTWMVVGAKGGGKTTTLALLARRGFSVLADDITVIDRRLAVHRGPRFLDLRGDISDALGTGTSVGVLGQRERWRHPLDDAPLTLPLGGIVIPGWGDAISVEHVTGSARLLNLAPAAALRVPAPWGALMMDVALSVPMLHWSRPRHLGSMEGSVDALLAAIGAASS